MKYLFIVAAALFCTGLGLGATRYVTPAGAGTTDGTSWANAYAGIADFRASYTAGDVVILEAGTYTLAAPLNFYKSVTVEPNDTSNVIIDCGNQYLQFNADSSAGNYTQTWGKNLKGKIIFQNNAAEPLISILPGTASGAIVFTNCEFKDDVANKQCVTIITGKGTTQTATFNNCSFEETTNGTTTADDAVSVHGSNTATGFTITNAAKSVVTKAGAFAGLKAGDTIYVKTGGHISAPTEYYYIDTWTSNDSVTLESNLTDGSDELNASVGVTTLAKATLNNCIIDGFYNNAATCHGSNQIIEVNGCTITDCGAPIASGYTGEMYIYGGTSIDGVTTGGMSAIATGAADRQSILVVDNITITNGYAGSQFIRYDGRGQCIIRNATLTDAAHALYRGIYITGNCNAVVENCILTGITHTDANAAIQVGSSVSTTTRASIKHNVFYSNRGGVASYSRFVDVTDNVFSTNTKALLDYSGYYFYDRKTSGHNCFYLNTSNYEADAATALKTSDVTSDPKFKDAPGGDYSLKSSSPCVRAGNATPNNGTTNIGAWQSSGSPRMGNWLLGN